MCPTFLVRCLADIDALNVDQQIIVGDFNLVLDTSIDKQGDLNITHEESKNYLLNYMEQNRLIDVWRQFKPDLFRFTWKRLNPTPVFVRLDFFLNFRINISICG